MPWRVQVWGAVLGVEQKAPSGSPGPGDGLCAGLTHSSWNARFCPLLFGLPGPTVHMHEFWVPVDPSADAYSTHYRCRPVPALLWIPVLEEVVRHPALPSECCGGTVREVAYILGPLL